MKALDEARKELDHLWAQADHTNDPDRIRELTIKILEKEKQIKTLIKQSNKS